jgi:hypothetical protein
MYERSLHGTPADETSAGLESEVTSRVNRASECTFQNNLPLSHRHELSPGAYAVLEAVPRGAPKVLASQLLKSHS